MEFFAAVMRRRLGRFVLFLRRRRDVWCGLRAGALVRQPVCISYSSLWVWVLFYSRQLGLCLLEACGVFRYHAAVGRG